MWNMLTEHPKRATSSTVVYYTAIDSTDTSIVTITTTRSEEDPWASETRPNVEPTPISTNRDGDNDGGDDESQAWIAGPVIGAIAGLLLIAGVIFFLYRRRRRPLAHIVEPVESPPFMPEKDQDYVPPGPHDVYEMDAGMAHELDGQPRHEMETVERSHELPGDGTHPNRGRHMA